MTRFEFLKSAGFGGAALMTLLTSCSKNSEVSPTTGSTGSVDFTLDLAATSNASLANSGGYVISNGVVVARTSQGTYVAATNTCSHEAKKKVIFSNGEFYCTEHGARYSTTGTGLNSYGANGLTVYKTELTGTSLRIYS
ncbi:Rieske (2Fe-2S) protein [Flectobacillus major]|jgi:nitrite reductase/ring-hydroxylating ferredoxin subunit|uniref:Rieske (2Fe-2S) protein n=1 Tax=Flectobacillus major TaxID=103 RepID=UPI0004207CD5|nr:Rieske 2Fe-2S domain-containing protein [Flectobacillus major]